MIATICKSCDTVSRVILDRCKYCGSKSLVTTVISEELVYKIDKRLKLRKAYGKQTHSPTKEA